MSRPERPVATATLAVGTAAHHARTVASSVVATFRPPSYPCLQLLTVSVASYSGQSWHRLKWHKLPWHLAVGALPPGAQGKTAQPRAAYARAAARRGLSISVPFVLFLQPLYLVYEGGDGLAGRGYEFGVGS